MKLRNKKTGEIIDLSKGSITDVGYGSSIQLQALDRYNKPIWNYNSLAELNEVWEDYEEPKDLWIIDAEKAVKKLEVWKRLKADLDLLFGGKE